MPLTNLTSVARSESDPRVEQKGPSSLTGADRLARTLGWFSIGLGMTIGVLNVFFRDVGQLYGVILQFWFWLTPIVYPASILPETMQKLMFYNPIAGLIAYSC